MEEFDIKWKKDLKYPVITKVCPVCNEEFKTQEGHSQEKYTCGYSCSNTYFRSGKNNGQFVSGNSAYRSTAFEAHGRLCNRCNESDYDVLIVHHIDRDRDNNDANNLEVLCANCHMREHKSI